MKALQLMDVPGNVIFISDKLAAAEGRKKKRKNKGALPEAELPTAEAAE